MSKLEGMFGAWRERVFAGGNSKIDRGDIKHFMYFQHWRTAKAAARLRHSHQQLIDNSWAPPPKEPFPSDKNLVISSMRYGLLAREMIADLKVRIIENRTKTDFVISDDPSVMLNRFDRERLNRSGFGVASSGLIFVMPLSPRYSVLCYDGQVYSLDVTEGRSILKSTSAVDAYNDIQMLSAAENIYFHRREDAAYVRERFLAVKDKRPAPSTVETFVPDGEDESREHYRPGTVEEGRQAKRSLISIRFNYPEPERWIPGLRYRTKPKVFYNGTGIGHVRKAEWLRGLPGGTRSKGSGKVAVIRTSPRPDGGSS